MVSSWIIFAFFLVWLSRPARPEKSEILGFLRPPNPLLPRRARSVRGALVFGGSSFAARSMPTRRVFEIPAALRNVAVAYWSISCITPLDYCAYRRTKRRSTISPLLPYIFWIVPALLNGAVVFSRQLTAPAVNLILMNGRFFFVLHSGQLVREELTFHGSLLQRLVARPLVASFFVGSVARLLQAVKRSPAAAPVDAAAQSC